MRKRDPASHKGDYGRVFVIAGSEGMTGAAIMAAQAAMRAGAGLVTLGIPASQNAVVASHLICAMTKPLPETEAKTISFAALEVILSQVEKSDVIALGPGLSRHEETQRLVIDLVSKLRRPTVVDADGLNALVGHLDIFGGQNEFILTPHPGEMARLMGTDVADVQRRRTDLAAELARVTGTIVVLKGYGTVVTDGRRVYVNQTGNAGMATGGAGDVLTGAIAGLRGQGMPALEAATLGVYVHGLAGDLARDRLGETAIIATDLLEELPEAFRRVEA